MHRAFVAFGVAIAAVFARASVASEPPCHGRVDDRMACAKCHRAVHEEWKGSAHARAFVDPIFQQALESRASPERCIPCHAPVSALDRLGQMPRARNDHRELGVDCRSCHVRNDTVHGPNGASTDAHKTEKDPTFQGRGAVALCTGCHDMRIADVLPLGREFLAATADDGDGDATCVSCHMESVRRAVAEDPGTGKQSGELRAGRSHALLGPLDADFCASAFLFTVEMAKGQASLVLRCGAGHGVPGLARLRSFLVRVQWLDKAAAVLREDTTTISWQNRLLVDEERKWEQPADRKAVALRVRVDHTFADRKPSNILDRTWELQ